MPKGSKVLMADDDDMLLSMYKERLQLAGYNVESYPDGVEALAHIQSFGPDIIMLDVMMPKLNGYDTLAKIKSDPATKNIPVVMLSALMRDFNRDKAVQGGAEDYLIKSEAMPSDVVTKIEQVLEKFGKGAVAVPGVAVAQPATNIDPQTNVATAFTVPQGASSTPVASTTTDEPIVISKPQDQKPQTKSQKKQKLSPSVIISLTIVTVLIIAGIYYYFSVSAK